MNAHEYNLTPDDGSTIVLIGRSSVRHMPLLFVVRFSFLDQNVIGL
jgi:hypothetical protein